MKYVELIAFIGCFVVLAIVGVNLWTYFKENSRGVAALAQAPGASFSALGTSAPVAPLPTWSITFTWDEPDGYNQPNPNVYVNGAYAWSAYDKTSDEPSDSGQALRQTLCAMQESAPGSGHWSCTADFPVGSAGGGMCLAFTVLHADPKAPHNGWCDTFDECGGYCSNKKGSFGRVSLVNTIHLGNKEDSGVMEYAENLFSDSSDCVRIGYVCPSIGF